MKKPEFDLIVIGGGAAGFFTAINAVLQQPTMRVALLEKTGKLLQKVKVSGGGRCNVTHACSSISQMVKCYPRGENFLKKAFHQFFTTDTIAWFQQRSVELHTEADGRMFPITNSSQTIIDCLTYEAERLGVAIKLYHGVKSFELNAYWNVETSADNTLTTNALCIACGGFPKIEQFDWITNNTNHTISPPLPSLFTFNLPGHPICQLMGLVAPQAEVKILGFKNSTKGPVLITHWGLSGPAVLRLSAFAARWLAEHEYSYTAIINWVPAFNENSLREYVIEQRQAHGNLKIANTGWFDLPQRLWLFILHQSGVHGDLRWAVLPAAAQNKLIKNLCTYELVAKGKTTYKDEFVTAGGVNLPEVDAQTMQSRLHPNLYFAGEILDVDGITGGFNFQNAWTTGFVAGQSAARWFAGQ